MDALRVIEQRVKKGHELKDINRSFSWLEFYALQECVVIPILCLAHMDYSEHQKPVDIYSS